MDPITTTQKNELGDVPTRYLETVATITTMERITVRSNGINIG